MYPVADVHAQSPSGDGAAAAMCAPSFDALNGTQDVDTFVMGNDTYAIVASYEDSAVQLIRIGEGGALSAVSSVFNGQDSGDTFFGGLAGAWGIDAFAMGNRTYAAVASWASSSIQMIRIHENGTMAAADMKSYLDDNSLVLYAASDVDTFGMNGAKYAVVSSYWGHGVQLFHIRENGTLTAVSNATNSKEGFEFNGAVAIDVFSMGNRTYAAVASQLNSAIQLIRIHENGTMTAAGSVYEGGWDGRRYFDELWGPRAINTFAIGDATYAIVASSWDNGVQLIRIHENGTMTAAGSATDNVDGIGPFDTLYWPAGVDTFDMGGAKYAVVSAYRDSGVQLIRIDEDGDLVSGGSIGGNGTLSHDLGGAVGISAFSLGGDPYAIVASYDDDAVQVVGISGDGSLRYVSSASHGDGGSGGECPAEARLKGPVPSMSPASRATDGGPVGFDELDGARDVDTFAMGGAQYAIVASDDDDGVQLIRIGSDGGSLSAAGTASDGVGGFDELGGATAVDAFAMGGVQYAIVASGDDDGVQLIRIDDNGAMSAAGSAADNAGGFWTLGQASGIDTFDMGGAKYAVVAAYGDSGVQLIQVHENGTLSAAGSATNNAGGFDALLGPRAVDAFAMGGDAYAVVASHDSHGVQLIRIHGNGTMSAAGSVFDTQGLESRLYGPYDVKAFDMGGAKYAIVAAQGDSGVQLIRIHENGTLSRAGSAADPHEFESDFADPLDAFESDFAPGLYGGFRIAMGQLEGASGVDTLVLGNRTYAIVASAYDEDAALLRVHENGTLAPVPGGTVAGGGGGSLYDFDGAEGIDAFAMGDRTYAIAASYRDDAVQVVRVGGDGELSAGPSVSDSTGGFVALDYAEDVDTFAMGNDTYAITASRQDGVQLVRIHGNGTMSAAGSIPEGDGEPGALRAPNAIDAFAAGDRTRAVATLFGTGVQLIDIYENGTVGLAGANGSGMAGIDGAAAVDTFHRCGTTYAAVASPFDDAVHLVRVHENGTLSVSASATKRDGGFEELYSPSAVKAFSIGANAYALVTLAEERVSTGGGETVKGNGVLMIRIDACGGGMTAVSSAFHGTGGYMALMSPRAVDVFRVGSQTYAMAASPEHDSAQLIRVRAGGTMSPAGHAVHDPDDAGGFDALEFASGIGTFRLAGSTYAMLPGSIASSVQVIRVSYNGTLFPAGSIRGDGGDFALSGASAVSAFEMGNHTYAVAASSLDNAVQLIRMAPSVGSVDSTSKDGAYGAGAVIDITARLYGRVNVTEPLELRLNSGGAAGLHSGNGTSTLTFRYEVAEGENADDLDYDGAGALSGSGMIVDALGIAAFRALPEPGSRNSLGGQRDIAVDTERPSVVSVSSPTGRGAHGTGERIAIHVKFTEPVYVSGMPVLGLETGGDDAQALYDRGGGTDTLVFSYRVRGGDVSDMLEYAGTGALDLDGGAIRDAADNNATLALPGTGSENSLGGSGIVVDGTSPSVLSVYSPNATGTYGTGDRIAIHVEFTGNVYVAGRPILELETGGGNEDGRAAYLEGSGTGTLVFVYHVRGGDRSASLDYTGTGALELAGGAITNRAERGAILALPDPRSEGSLFGSGIAVDGTSPSVLSVHSPNATGAYGAGKRIAIHVEFTEAVYVAGMPVLGLETGGDDAQAMYVSGSGTDTLVFAYTVRNGDASADLGYAGTAALALGDGGAIQSNAGNDAVLVLPDMLSPDSLAGSSDIRIDTQPPTIESVYSPNATGAYGAGKRIAIHVEFTEPVYAAGAAHLGLELETGGSGGNARAAYLEGSGTGTLVFIYDVGEGDVSADLGYAGTGALELGEGSIADGAGNSAVPALPAPGSANSLGGRAGAIEIDTSRPSIASVSSPNATGKRTAPATALQSTSSSPRPSTRRECRSSSSRRAAAMPAAAEAAAPAKTRGPRMFRAAEAPRSCSCIL